MSLSVAVKLEKGRQVRRHLLLLAPNEVGLRLHEVLEPHLLGRTEVTHVERVEPPIEEALVEADGVVELRAASQLD